MSEIERLNMIAEWQEQHKQLIKDLDNSKKHITELEKENAKLKNERNAFKIYSESAELDAIELNEQLTKAKVCLEQLVSEITVGELEVDPNVLQQAENFLKE